MPEKKILIIDDEPNVCEFLSEFLLTRGFQTVSCYDGREALNTIQRENFDLIILDLIMPVMNGIQFLEALQNVPIQTPIIVLSGIKDHKIAQTSMELGALEFVPKPIDLTYLENVILMNLI